MWKTDKVDWNTDWAEMQKMLQEMSYTLSRFGQMFHF